MIFLGISGSIDIPLKLLEAGCHKGSIINQRAYRLFRFGFQPRVNPGKFPFLGGNDFFFRHILVGFHKITLFLLENYTEHANRARIFWSPSAGPHAAFSRKILGGAIGSGEPDFRFRQIHISAFLFDFHNTHVSHHGKLYKDTADYHD